MHIEFGTGASVFLVIFTLFFAVVTVGLFAAIAFALNKLGQQVERLTGMAEPLVAKASNTLDTVQRITVNVGEKADSILSKGETITDDLAEKVERTSTVVQKAVTNPLINLSGIISGLSTGFSTWGRSAGSHAREAVGTPPRNGVVATEERVTVTSDGR